MHIMGFGFKRLMKRYFSSNKEVLPEEEYKRKENNENNENNLHNKNTINIEINYETDDTDDTYLSDNEKIYNVARHISKYQIILKSLLEYMRDKVIHKEKMDDVIMELKIIFRTPNLVIWNEDNYCQHPEHVERMMDHQCQKNLIKMNCDNECIICISCLRKNNYKERCPICEKEIYTIKNILSKIDDTTLLLADNRNEMNILELKVKRLLDCLDGLEPITYKN